MNNDQENKINATYPTRGMLVMARAHRIQDIAAANYAALVNELSESELPPGIEPGAAPQAVLDAGTSAAQRLTHHLENAAVNAGFNAVTRMRSLTDMTARSTAADPVMAEINRMLVGDLARGNAPLSPVAPVSIEHGVTDAEIPHANASEPPKLSAP